MSDERIPTELWVDGHIRRLMNEGKGVYVANRGAYASGTVLLKIATMDGYCRLLSQVRDMDGALGWMNALSEEKLEEREADAYIKRSIDRDPDLWVIEIEDKEGKNPFEGKYISYG